VAVQPSFAETGGGGAIESAACGLPVIASRTGGLQDTVSDGITGFLIEPGDSDELGKRIMDFRENPIVREEMGRAGRNHIVQNYGWDNTIERYIKMYSSLMQK
jgi:glycosyltransferase involved in cell wall biosynthesis